MKIKLFLFTRQIGPHRYSATIPCSGWDDANDIATKSGMEATGEDVHTVTCIPVQQFMSFLDSLMEGNEADYRIRWKPHAQEQIEAFLSLPWPEQPNQLD